MTMTNLFPVTIANNVVMANAFHHHTLINRVEFATVIIYILTAKAAFATTK